MIYRPSPIPVLVTQASPSLGTFPVEDWHLDFTPSPHDHFHKHLMLIKILEVCWYFHRMSWSLTHLIWRGCGHLQVLLIELVPWFGPPKSFQSDYRPLSYSQNHTQRFTEALEIDYKLHTFWHPESKTNDILKKTLAKLCQETMRALNQAVLRIPRTSGHRMRTDSQSEMTYGRPFLLLTFFCMRTWTRTSSEGSPGLCTQDTANSH